MRSAFLQNRRYMGAFYRDGYTVLEMEAGPFLGAIYELIYPHATAARRDRPPERQDAVRRRLPALRVGHAVLAAAVAALEEPQLLRRRRTYACAIAIVRRILEQEVARVETRR